MYIGYKRSYIMMSIIVNKKNLSKPVGKGWNIQSVSRIELIVVGNQIIFLTITMSWMVQWAGLPQKIRYQTLNLQDAGYLVDRW